MRVLGDLSRLGSRRHPQKAAFIFGSSTLTHAEVNERSNRLAHGLAALGVAKGDRVALLARNCLDYAVVTQAVAKSGAIIVPINPRYTTYEIEHVLSDCGPRVLFVEQGLLDSAERAIERALIRSLLVSMSAVRADATIRGLEDVMTGDGDAGPDRDVDPADPATIMYTSGTTGKPKGVLYAHGMHFTLFEAQLVELDFQHDDVVHLASPLFTNGGLNGGINTTLLIGATGVLHTGSFEPDRIVKLIEQHRITVGFWVPTMLALLLQHPAIGTCDCSSVAKIYYGSMPIGSDLLTRAGKAFPSARFYQLYGSTECGAVGILRPEDHLRWSHVTGREIFNCESRIIDEAGLDVPVGGVGELIVRQCSSGMIGYWANPQATAETIRDGWIHSGDLMRVEGEGYFTVVDRKRDLIISGADNIYSKEVELAIASHPAVREVAVFGVPDETYGEKVCAAIALQPGASLTELELEAHCLALLARYKRPRLVEFHDDLPKNSMGKIVKPELRKRHWQDLSRSI